MVAFGFFFCSAKFAKCQNPRVHDKQLHMADVTPSVSNFQSSSFISQKIHFPRVAEVSSKATTLNLGKKRKTSRGLWFVPTVQPLFVAGVETGFVWSVRGERREGRGGALLVDG
ncbi:hypothetical protein J3E68DRAFT_96401 [Trichoderma sp. SZMC 28012]